ncbi:MAG: hypothetical protein NZM41_12455 [Saprospiraceae bacterium]|nr:hypothetical protein [Saprospiraceae bacterium]
MPGYWLFMKEMRGNPATPRICPADRHRLHDPCLHLEVMFVRMFDAAEEEFCPFHPINRAVTGCWMCPP